MEALLNAAKTQESKDMSALDDQIQILKDDLTAETTVVAGVNTFVRTVPQLIADAVAKAIAAGATPAQLQASRYCYQVACRHICPHGPSTLKQRLPRLTGRPLPRNPDKS